MSAATLQITLRPTYPIGVEFDKEEIDLVFLPALRGPGLPPGGTTNQVARKASNADMDIEWHTLDDADIAEALGYTAEDHAAKDASGGFAGLTGFLINLKNAAGAVVSFLDSAATVARTWTFPDKSGTVAMTSDVITDHTGLSNIGANTHAQIDTALARLANTSGMNTGDQDLSAYATLVAVANGYQPLDSDLTAIAALSTTSFGRALLVLADAAAMRAAAGLGTLATQDGTFSGTSSGTNTGDQTTVTGNAGTATALQTPRRINGKLFDGTADISTFNRTGVKTANYTAAANELVPCDSTSGGFTVALPTAPANGSQVAVKHITQGGTNTITVACGGSDVINKAAGATSTTLRLLAEAVIVQYDAATAIWTVIADDVPITQLDARYSFKPAYVAVADGVTITPALIANDTTRVTQTNTQGAGTLTIANPTGTPVDGEILILRETCTNVQTLVYGTAYLGTNQLSLPAATTGGGKTDRQIFEYRTASLKYELIGISFGA
jgi:hypothetical protein